MTAVQPAHRLLLIAAFVLVLVYGIGAMVVRPIVWSDSAFGFLAWDARDSLPFNFTLAIDPADISRDVVTFMSVWSPGQHLLVAAFEAAGLSLGAAIVVIVTAFAMAGLAGWYVLYRTWGFSRETSALTVLLVALSRHVSAPYAIYVGGEVLLFGVAPWFLWLVWQLRTLPWWAPLPLLAGAFCMFFAKLSAIIFATAAIAAIVVAPGGPLVSRRRLHAALIALLTIAVLGSLFYWLWYSRGWTAAVRIEDTDWSALPEDIAFAVSATWSAAFSLMDLAAYLVLHPDRAVLRDYVPIAYVFLPAALITIIAVSWRLRRSFGDYLRFVGAACGLFAAVLIWLWVGGSEIVFEERYFRIGSLMLLVGIVEAARGLVRWRMPLAAAALAVYAVYGIGSYALHVRTNLGYPMGSRGFRHQTASRAVLDLAARIDAEAPDRQSTLVFAAWPEIGLEFRRVRVFATHADVVPPAQLRTQALQGHVRNLYVLVHTPLVRNGKAELILEAFKDYSSDRWRIEPLDGATVYAQTE